MRFSGFQDRRDHVDQATVPTFVPALLDTRPLCCPRVVRGLGIHLGIHWDELLRTRADGCGLEVVETRQE